MKISAFTASSSRRSTVLLNVLTIMEYRFMVASLYPSFFIQREYSIAASSGVRSWCGGGIRTHEGLRYGIRASEIGT